MSMLTRKEWRLNPDVPLAGALTERIFASRGLQTPAEIAAFLNPDLEKLHDPFQLPDMDPACALIARALADKQLITIHGDYDVDGISATALLSRFFRRLGADCQEIIPDRMADGYGLISNCAERMIASGSKMLITVDCGIAGLEEIRRLGLAGIQVIVTDHHECLPELPAAAAVINPKRPDSRYPFRELAGVGVALKLVQALCLSLNLGDLWTADLELAALGTVADVVPLRDENRIIVKAGLQLIPKMRQPGLTALVNAVGMSGKVISAQTMGYVLAPRINAAGRLGDAAAALALLLTDDPATAAAAAGELADLNKRRQELEAEITAEAIAEIDSEFDFSSRDMIIIAHDGWHQGVIGIVAARLAEQYCRPVIVLSGEEGQFRGSCRTWGDFDMLEAIRQAEGHTLKFGGHRKAAGLIVAREQLGLFCRAVNDYSNRTLQPDCLMPVLQADLIASPSELTLENAAALQNLAPFGEDNPQPCLVCRRMTLISVRPAGNGRHLKLQLAASDTAQNLDGIGFGLGDADELFAAGDQVDVLFSLEINTWMGRSSLQLNVRDIAHSQNDNEFLDRPWIADELFREKGDLRLLMEQYRLPIRDLLPTHDEYKVVYQFIRTQFGQRPVLADLALLARRISRNYRTELNMFRLARILTVFQETSLISLQQLGEDRVRLALLPAAARVHLEDSPTYQRLEAEGVEG